VPAEGRTVAYGEYLANSCRYCHGKKLDGGLVLAGPTMPASTNLTPAEDGIAHYTEEGFVRALREGLKPDGTSMETIHMPWQATAGMKDVEIQALWAYLNTLEPQPTGGSGG
jgi:cytochrome c553